MYQALLTRRYLTSKIVPYVGIGAVLLCSALVLIVWSIMGGFLTVLLAIGRDMEGDVSIAWPNVGFAHYEDLIQRLEADPMVAAAAPLIETFGIVTLPDGRKPGVQIKGVDARYAKVTNYAQALWWKPIERPVPKDKARADIRLRPQNKELMERLYKDGLRMSEFDTKRGEDVPAVVLGIEMSQFSVREQQGFYRPARAIGIRTAEGELDWIEGFITEYNVTLTLLPLTEKTRSIDLVQRTLPVANEFRTGLFESDKSTVLVQLAELQRNLKMDAWERLEPASTDPYELQEGDDGSEITPVRRAIGVEPGRVTTVLVKANSGITPEQLRVRCIEIYGQFAQAHPGDVPDATKMDQSNTITTYEMSRATFVNAVKQETVIVLLLLMLISFVAAFLIMAIFWAMVSEKTKDIGTLRAIGASRAGVAWLWLRYGVIIGVVGACLGLLVAYGIVWNINPIHEWIGRVFNRSIWDPKVYYFATIPNHVETWRAVVVGVTAVIFSLLGAVVPAMRAALMDPVRALRFE